jgi:hypothetical protein
LITLSMNSMALMLIWRRLIYASSYLAQPFVKLMIPTSLSSAFARLSHSRGACTGLEQ